MIGHEIDEDLTGIEPQKGLYRLERKTRPARRVDEDEGKGVLTPLDKPANVVDRILEAAVLNGYLGVADLIGKLLELNIGFAVLLQKKATQLMESQRLPTM